MDRPPVPDPRSALHLDAGLARALAEAIGVPTSPDPPDPRAALDALVSAMARALPIGTVAKHEAIAAGVLPPGADADGCARLALDQLDGPRPTPTSTSWTCWVITTLARGLVGSLWGWPARIVATRNLDGRVPVDFHSVVEVDAPGATFVLDPLFAVGPIPVGGSGVRGAWAGTVKVEPDGRRHYRWATPGGTDARYRSVTEALDADDIATFLHISTTHTGMSGRRWWRISGTTTCASLTDDAECGPLLKRYTHDGRAWAVEESFIDRWTDATSAAIDHVWHDGSARVEQVGRVARVGRVGRVQPGR